MTTFTLIIFILFVCTLAFQFVKAIEANCSGLIAWFAFEIIAFGYLAKVMM